MKRTNYKNGIFYFYFDSRVFYCLVESYFNPFTYFKISNVKMFQGNSVPNLAHGKMYKRYTFGGILPFHSEVVSGIEKD